MAEVKEDVKVNENSSVDTILEEASKQPEEDETSEESSTTEESTDKTGEVEKTQEEEKEPASEESDEGKPIPYQRFKQVNEEKVKFASNNETLLKEKESLKAELEESQGLLNDPEVLRVVMNKKGYTKEAIDKEIADRGLTQTKPEPKGEYDFTKQEDWQKYIDDQVEAKVGKVQQETALVKQQISARETTIRLEKEGKEASELCKELGIEYGDESKDEDLNDINKATGLINSFIIQNPMKGELMKRGFMSKSEALILALKGKGFKLGEQKGVKKEKDRQENLKNASMESEEKLSKADTPNADWSVEKLMEFSRTHPNAKVNY